LGPFYANKRKKIKIGVEIKNLNYKMK